MAEQDRRLSREEVAQLEIGHTAIGRRSAWFLTLTLLACLIAVPILQTVHEWRHRDAESGWMPQYWEVWTMGAPALDAFRGSGPGLWPRMKAANAVLLERIHRYESRLEDESILTQTLLGPTQLLLLRHLGVGNEQAYLGRDGWLFYRPGVDYCTGPGFLEAKQLARRAMEGNEWTPHPQPDPVKAILDFHGQLEARGIRLILMPTTVKPTLYWSRLAPEGTPWFEPVHNRSYATFLERLSAAGVTVFDPTEILAFAPQLKGASYFKTDTHWRPWAMERVAAELSAFVRAQGMALEGDARWFRREHLVQGMGDIAVMLSLPEDQALFEEETAQIHPVFDADGLPFSPDPAAEVLLLGDSFSNIFSNEEMGWGGHAGLAEQLAYALQMPVDRIIRNDSGAHATRRMLATEMSRGRDRLAGKRVVIWQFAARELAMGDWQMIPLPDPGSASASPGGFLVPGMGARRVVEGRLAAASPVPVPGSVPYKDHIRSLHLIDLVPVGGGAALEADQAVVYVWSMRDNRWTASATWEVGDRVRLELSPWSEYEGELGTINRSDLEDFELQLADPCWGEVPVSP
ncbi:MAG: alginate O-acetyltransferase AlgX-related protein [Verrucomicrobiota bacterium]|jgi:hypothetical protein